MTTGVISIVKGSSRYENIAQALDLIEEQIEFDLRGKHKILIKPNLVSTSNQLAATHVDGVRALLDFLLRFRIKEIIIAEGATIGDTFDGYRNYGYLDLRAEYGVELIDLNQDDYETIEIFDENFDPITVRVSKIALESDYRISISPPKTHDTVVVTLSLKNMALGSILKEDKGKIHQGYKAININIFKIGRLVFPHLAVLDGFEAMEGEGPCAGSKVDLKTAIASTDFLAADAVTTNIMGFNPREVGYLYYCDLAKFGTIDISNVEIRGSNIDDVKKEFKPHSMYEAQKRWMLPLHQKERIMRQISLFLNPK